MNNFSEQLGHTARKAFEAAGAILSDPADSASLAAVWELITELGLPLALVPEEQGGSGLEFGDLVVLFREAGAQAVSFPIFEAVVGTTLLARAGIDQPSGMVTLAPIRQQDRFDLTRSSEGWRIAGRAQGVPWGRSAESLVCLAHYDGDLYVAAVAAADAAITPGENMAGEPCDTVVLDCKLGDKAVAPLQPGVHPLLLGAAARTAQIAGALETLLALTARYAQDRVQFGRPIGKFQAIQQLSAQLAGHVAIAGAAADLAAEAVERGDRMNIACGKASASSVAGPASAIAHQVHGAIGVTREHSLHRWTLRLLSWRDDYGGERHWNAEIGRSALAEGGGAALWQMLTR